MTSCVVDRMTSIGFRITLRSRDSKKGNVTKKGISEAPLEYYFKRTHSSVVEQRGGDGDVTVLVPSPLKNSRLSVVLERRSLPSRAPTFFFFHENDDDAFVVVR